MSKIFVQGQQTKDIKEIAPGVHQITGDRYIATHDQNALTLTLYAKDDRGELAQWRCNKVGKSWDIEQAQGMALEDIQTFHKLQQRLERLEVNQPQRRMEYER